MFQLCNYLSNVHKDSWCTLMAIYIPLTHQRCSYMLSWTHQSYGEVKAHIHRRKIHRINVHLALLNPI